MTVTVNAGSSGLHAHQPFVDAVLDRFEAVRLMMLQAHQQGLPGDSKEEVHTQLTFYVPLSADPYLRCFVRGFLKDDVIVLSLCLPDFYPRVTDLIEAVAQNVPGRFPGLLSDLIPCHNILSFRVSATE